ncbi:MAG: phenylalanine--tRNA ligase subunit alpha [Acholeplasmatales bacterium]|nr:phenylalanine--tRNA ligase subunit alpha [Acholeplasmatales bacterium]
MELENIELVATEEIEKCDDLDQLNETRVKYLGKKGLIQGFMSKMRDLSNEERPKFGALVNKIKAAIEERIKIAQEKLEEKKINKKLESEAIDVTLPGYKFNTGVIHPLMQTIEEIEDLFIGMGYEIAEGPEVEEDLYNFELLNLPKDHPARDMQDTFYINPNVLLRTHTSPVQARTMQAKQGKPIKVICPGKVYRRDDDDATHSHQFMQVEGLVLGKDISLADLKGTLLEVAKKVFGNEREIRLRPSFFPFTEPSVEVDVSCFKCNGKGCSICKNSGWIEVLGAGMVNNNVLKMNGYNPDEIQGFAFGIGVERFTMLKYGIEDIRNFYLNDQKFLNQFKGVK